MNVYARRAVTALFAIGLAVSGQSAAAARTSATNGATHSDVDSKMLPLPGCFVRNDAWPSGYLPSNRASLKATYTKLTDDFTVASSCILHYIDVTGLAYSWYGPPSFMVEVHAKGPLGPLVTAQEVTPSVMGGGARTWHLPLTPISLGSNFGPMTYWVSVQGMGAPGDWMWQLNVQHDGEVGLYRQTLNPATPCYSQLTPLTTCASWDLWGLVFSLG